MKVETLTIVLVNLAGIMEKADESLLPGVYKEVGEALHTDPTGLGSLTLFRSMVQSACYPIAAYLAVGHNRTHVIAYGAFLWAAATFLVAFSTTFFQVECYYFHFSLYDTFYFGVWTSCLILFCFIHFSQIFIIT